MNERPSLIGSDAMTPYGEQEAERVRRQREGWVTVDTPTPTQDWAPKFPLGRQERTCDGCGKRWEGPDRCGNCGGLEFTERVVKPTVMQLVGGKLQRSLDAEKKLKTPDPADLEALSRLVEVGRLYVAALHDAGAAAVRLVNLDRRRYDFLQGKLSTAAGRGPGAGDWDTRQMNEAPPIAQQVDGFGRFLEQFIALDPSYKEPTP